MPSNRRQAITASQLLRQLLSLSPAIGANLDRRSAAGHVVSAIAEAMTVDHVALHAVVADDGDNTLADSGPNPSWATAGIDPNSLVAQCSSRARPRWQSIPYRHPHGSRTLAVFPIFIDRNHQATLVLDRDGDRPLSATEVAVVHAVLGEYDPLLHAAFQFHQLRMHGLSQDRDRLTRTLQNGVAQELGALGLQVDLMRLSPTDERATRDSLDGMRAEISSILGDLRSGGGRWASADPGPSTLGALICQRVQAQCGATGMRANISLHEDSQRLAPQLAAALFAAVQGVLNAAQLGGASDVIVEFTARGNRVQVTARHQGAEWLPPIDAPATTPDVAIRLLPCGTGIDARQVCPAPAAAPAAALAQAAPD